MHRLFVALRPPFPIRDHLLGCMGGVAGARWQSDAQLHVTLRFIGEVDRHLARDVDAALGGVHHPPFAVRVTGLGLFDRRGIPDTLWAGLAPPEPLHALHNKIDRALSRVGIPPDTRAFLPHVTLARLGRGTGSVAAFMETANTVATEPFAVDHFALFESELTPEGAVYTQVERYALG